MTKGCAETSGEGSELHLASLSLISPSNPPVTEPIGSRSSGVGGRDWTRADGPSPAPREVRPDGRGGKTTARYEILRPHASGGLGRVYIARDNELHRRVALKEILPVHAEDPVSRERFVFEAEVTGSLEHPGIVPVYGMGWGADGRPFYAMRFIEGEDLASAARRFHANRSPDYSGREFRWLLHRFVDLCNTIAYVHSRGVLHRDIKPSNVMLGPFGETLIVLVQREREERPCSPS
jgi:serine/threonine protein kinase